MAISQLEIRVAVLRVAVKWTRKLKNIQKIPPLPKQKWLKNIDNITKLDECPCQDSIQGLQLRKPVTNQWLTSEATNPSARLQAILDRAIFNWYSNNVWALTSEMRALQLDQLSEHSIIVWLCFVYLPIK